MLARVPCAWWWWSLVALSGCAAGRQVECRAHGGPEWTEARSEHFHLRTNLPPARAQAQLQYGEQQLKAIRWATDYQGPLPPIEVIAVEPEQLKAFEYDLVGLATLKKGSALQVVYEAWESSSQQQVRPGVLTHELTHVVAFVAFAKMPRWLSEGLAQFMETATFSDLRTVKVGTGELGWQNTVYERGLVSVDALWRWGTEEEPRGAQSEHLYATAWAYVHYLLNHQRARLFAVLEALRKGAPGRVAFEAVFPHLESELGVAVLKYVDGGAITTSVLTLADPPGPSPTTPMTPAAVHLARREIWAHAFRLSSDVIAEKRKEESSLAAGVGGGDNDDTAVARFEDGTLRENELLRRFPDSVAAKRAFVVNRPTTPGAAALLREVLAAHPHDDLVRGLLALALTAEGPAATSLVREQVEQLTGSDDPSALAAAAVAAALVQECASATSLLSRAQSVMMGHSATAERVSTEILRLCQAPRPPPTSACNTGDDGLPRQVIDEHLHRHDGSFNAALQLLLTLGASNDETRLLLTFVIEPDGGVTVKDVTSTPASPLLANAYARILARIRFPPPCGGAPLPVSFPLWAGHRTPR